MMCVGGLTTPPVTPLCMKTPSISVRPLLFSLLFQSQPCKHHNALLLLKRTGFCLFAQKKQQNSTLSRTKLESQDFDDEFEVDDDEDEDDHDELDEDVDEDMDDDDELMVPFHKMDDWLKKKPRGFGEGKVYDTSIEDKLLEELEKTREAQLANINKLKNEAKVSESKKELNEVRASEVLSGCARVRINNLPKKRNIHRDLKSAFKGVCGIANILPMVSGTKKTRDPVCKGFAFVDFKSLEDANRFLQLFSGQKIAFGKTEKRIKCEIVKSSDASNVESVNDVYNSVSESCITVLEDEGDIVDDIDEPDPQLDSWDDDDFDDSDDSDEDFDEKEIMAKFKSLNSMKKSDIESIEARLLKRLFDPLPTKQKEKKVDKKKPVLEKKPDSAMKLKVPGYAERNVRSLQDSHASISDLTIIVLEKERDQVNDLGEHDPQLDSWEDDDFDELDEDFDEMEIMEKFKSLNSMKKSDIESVESRLLKQSFVSLPTKQKVKKVGKKKPVLTKKPDNAMMNVPGSEKSDVGSVHDVYTSNSESSITDFKEKGDQADDIGEHDPQLDSWEDDDCDDLDEDFDDKEIMVKFKSLSSTEKSDINSVESRFLRQSSDSLPTKQKEKRVGKKKPAHKKKPDNAMKLKIPGSAKRLKVHEKAKLADVYSRYAVKQETLASKET